MLQWGYAHSEGIPRKAPPEQGRREPQSRRVSGVPQRRTGSLYFHLEPFPVERSLQFGLDIRRNLPASLPIRRCGSVDADGLPRQTIEGGAFGKEEQRIHRHKGDGKHRGERHDELDGHLPFAIPSYPMKAMPLPRR